MIPKDVVLEKVRQIDQDLFADLEAVQSPSLMNGLGGITLFYINLAKALQDESLLAKASDLIDRLIHLLNTNEVTHSYCDGITGIGYLLNYLDETNSLDIDVTEFLEDVDAHVLKETHYITHHYRDLDFLHGGIGMGMYLLSRYGKNPSLSSPIIDALNYLIDLIDHDLTGDLPVNLITNLASPNEQPIRFFNLGMAHGASAYLVYLTRYLQRFPNNERALDVLTKLVRHIQTFYRPANNRTEGSFPDIITYGKPYVYKVPLGWCYGDLSLSISLYMAGDTLANSALKQFAENLALGTLQRNSSDSAHLMDACFCHGTTSMAQAYRIWYQITRNEDFKQAYDRWIQLTLEAGQFSDGIGGFKKFTGTETGQAGAPPKYDRISGLLDGASGVGLVLTDYLELEKMDWEKFLLWN